MEIAGKRQKMAENGREQLEMAGNGWKLSNCCKWLKIKGNCWKWLALLSMAGDGNSWKKAENG